MPIYGYQCTACGAEEEHIQKMSDDPITECSTCGGRLERQVSAAAFHLKGGGWYKDGYASARPAGGGGDSDGGSKSSGGSDSGSSGSSGGDSGGSSSSSAGSSD